MEYYHFFLVPHIISGFLALVVAPVALIVKKGGKAHRLWGMVFFYAMTMVAVTSTIMSVLKPNIFLCLVGIFSFYQVASGYRAIYRRNIESFKDVKLVDWSLVSFSGLFSAGMLFVGILIFLKQPLHPLGVVACLLGSLGLFLSVLDVVRFNMKGFHKKNWMISHMTGMIGGYIATVSAFSVINFAFLPDVIRWMWPTFIGVPLLLMLTGKYKKKQKPTQIISEIQA